MSPRKSRNPQLGSQEKLPKESGGRKTLKREQVSASSLPPREALSDHHLDLNKALLTLLSTPLPLLITIAIYIFMLSLAPELVPDPTRERN